MPALFVSNLLALAAELGLFGLLWLQSPTINLIVVAGHLATAVLASFWFSLHWVNPSIETKKLRFFIAGLIFLLPVIGSIFLLLIDNRSALREHGIKEGLGSEDLKIETPQDLLHYFSAPSEYVTGNIRRTRSLLSSLDDEAYLGLLIASRHLPDKEAYLLLNEALFSPFESARLLAYSLRGKLEDRIADAREGKKVSLSATTSTQRKIDLHIAIAQDCLHAIDVGIESSDRNGIIKQASQHCIQALKLDNKSSSGFRTLSKILRFQGNVDQAKKAEQRALTLASA